MSICQPLENSPEKILIVDDDSALADLFCRVLAMLEFDPYMAFDSGSAGTLLDQHRFNALVIDILPGTGTQQVVAGFREANPQAPIILLTGYAPAEANPVAVEIRASLLLQKPVAISDVARHLRKLLALNDADMSMCQLVESVAGDR